MAAASRGSIGLIFDTRNYNNNAIKVFGFHSKRQLIENIIIVRYNNSLAISLWLQMLKLKYITCNIVQIN